MISKKLAQKVIEQLGHEQWNNEVCKTLEDVVSNGASAGFGNFIYYSDTCKFARDNMEEILKSIKETAEGMCEDPLKMIQNYPCLGTDTINTLEIASVIYDKPDEATLNDGTDTQVLNALAWFALEETACEVELEISELV